MINAPHFQREEFACSCGCGFDTIDAETLAILEMVRTRFRAQVFITSGARCQDHNATVGGVGDSQHVEARAADFKVDGVPPDVVADWLDAGPLAGWGGLGRYETFTHLDTRAGPAARWHD